MSIEQHMTDTDWNDLIPRLVLYAASRTRRMYWGRGSVDGPRGMEPADFVNDAILKTLSGERAWDYKNKPLANHLMDVMKSDVSNLANSKENALTSIMTENDILHLSSQWDVEKEVAMKLIFDKFFEYVRRAAPSILYTAISIYKHDEKNPSQIANDNGTSLNEVKRDLRRLYRLTEDFGEHLRISIRGGELSNPNQKGTRDGD